MADGTLADLPVGSLNLKVFDGEPTRAFVL